MTSYHDVVKGVTKGKILKKAAETGVLVEP